MLRKIFATLGAAALAIGSIGAASAATITIFEQEIGDPPVEDSLIVANEYLTGSGDLTARSVFDTFFSDEYFFDVIVGGIEWLTSVEAIFEPPLGGQGVKNLTIAWAGGSTLYITSDTGEQCDGVLAGCMGFDATSSDPFTFAQLLASGSTVLTITGTTFSNGGKYNLFITAVPLPAAALLFGSALLGGGLMRRRKMIKEFGLPA